MFVTFIRCKHTPYAICNEREISIYCHLKLCHATLKYDCNRFLLQRDRDRNDFFPAPFRNVFISSSCFSAFASFVLMFTFQNKCPFIFNYDIHINGEY